MKELNLKLKKEIEIFKEIGHQFLDKKISIGEFKGISGGMGVYAQRGGEKFMIRLRTASGIISLKHLKIIESFTEKYNIENLHLTTRQTIQLHDLSIDEVCDIMEEALENDLYTRGGGGNFPRNTSLSPMSGVEKNEVFDVTEFALKVNDYLMEKITEYKLPRKLKISFSSSEKDTANATISDLGFVAVEKDGKGYFQLYLAGGLGNNPGVSIPYEKLVDPKEVLYYLEAMIQLFVAEGDYTNKAKARTRYIPRRMGIDEFLAAFDRYLENVRKNNKLDVEIEAVLSETQKNYSHKLKDTEYLKAQRQDGLYTLIIHPLNGQLQKKDFKKIVSFIEKNQKSEVRLSMEESIYIRNLTEKEVIELLQITENFRQESKIAQSISCIGIPTCQIGIEQSQTLVNNILSYLKENNIPEDRLPSVYVSGCQNSCARHQAAELGFAGGKKKVKENIEDVFDVYVGGKVCVGETKLGEKLGTILMGEIPQFIGELAEKLENAHLDYSDYLQNKNNEFLELIKKYIV